LADITNNWNKSMPSGTSLVSEGDDLMRQHWGTLEDTHKQEHYFNDSVTSAGIHKHGSARIFSGNISNLSTAGADDANRMFYAVDDQSLHLLGTSVTTKIAGAQEGGVVRSLESNTFGWYISSYTTGDHGSDDTHLWANANGNPMLYRDGTERLLGFSTSTTGPSATTDINVPIVWSVTSSGIKVQIANWGEDYGTAATGAGIVFGEQAAGSLIAHVSGMGLLPISELS